MNKLLRAKPALSETRQPYTVYCARCKGWLHKWKMISHIRYDHRGSNYLVSKNYGYGNRLKGPAHKLSRSVGERR